MRILTLILALALCAAPGLAATGDSGKDTCAAAEDSPTSSATGKSKPAVGKPGESAPVRASGGGEDGPRWRSRWQSMLPGMMK